MSDIESVSETAVETAPKKPRRPKGRSPAYPAIDLEKAVQRAGQLYKRDRQFPISVSQVASIWGYASLNGPAALTVSALKKFGLIDDEGTKEDRTIAVSDLAVQILNHPSSDARAQAVKEAALNPPIHLEMWDEYGVNLPSDPNLVWRLTRDRGFTETGAREFIREYRGTLAFADLGEEDASSKTAVADEGDADASREVLEDISEPSTFLRHSLSDDPGPSLQAVFSQFSGQMTPAEMQTEAPVIQSYPIPIALQGRPPVMVSGAFPLSSTEWNQFKAVLEAMRPVLVKEEPGMGADKL